MNWGIILFENQKDDATNIHGIYVQIVAVEAPDIVVTELKHSQQFGFDFLKEGKEIEIVGGKSLITKSRNKVLEAERINKSLTRIKLTEPLPVGTGMVMQLPRYVPIRRYIFMVILFAGTAHVVCCSTVVVRQWWRTTTSIIPVQRYCSKGMPVSGSSREG